MSTQPPLESALRPRLETVFADIQMEPIPEGQDKAPLASFFFNTTGPGNRLSYTGTLTLHFNEDDALAALRRAYATENDIIAALPGEVIVNRVTGEVVVAVPPGANEDDYYTPYTITGVRLQARGPVFNDDLAFLGVECAYTVEYTIRR